MLSNSIIRCTKCGRMGHSLFQCRRAMCQIWCYRCKEYGHKAYNCRGLNRTSELSRNYNSTNRTNQRPTFNRQNKNRGNPNANAESRPTLHPSMFPAPSKQLTQTDSMPDYVPLDVWNPYTNFPTVHHTFREGQWWINRSSFEIDKYYREIDENEEIVADAIRRGVPHGKVTDESDTGYEGENPASFFKALGIPTGDDDPLPPVSGTIIWLGDCSQKSEEKKLLPNRFKRAQKWPVRPKIRQNYRRAKIFRPYGQMKPA